MAGRVWPRHNHRGRPLNSIVRCHLNRSFDRRVIGARVIVAGVSGPFFVGAWELVQMGRALDAAIAAGVGGALILFALLATREWLGVLWPGVEKNQPK
jgi:hypothetical protein